MRVALVHSPAVGPSTWRWVGEELRAAGHDVVVPDLVDAARTGDPYEFARAAVAGAGSVDAVVGHSGAGAVLPLVAAGVGGRAITLFVDAGIPPCAGAFQVGGEFLAVLRDLATDGELPRWSQWFGPEVVRSMVPGDSRRRAVEDEQPNLSLAFYEASVEVPGGWCDGPNAYLLLSDAYRADAERAKALGWPVAERPGPGQHLDLVTHERDVAAQLLTLVDR